MVKNKLENILKTEGDFFSQVPLLEKTDESAEFPRENSTGRFRVVTSKLSENNYSIVIFDEEILPFERTQPPLDIPNYVFASKNYPTPEEANKVHESVVRYLLKLNY